MTCFVIAGVKSKKKVSLLLVKKQIINSFYNLFLHTYIHIIFMYVRTFPTVNSHSSVVWFLFHIVSRCVLVSSWPNRVPETSCLTQHKQCDKNKQIQNQKGYHCSKHLSIHAQIYAPSLVSIAATTERFIEAETDHALSQPGNLEISMDMLCNVFMLQKQILADIFLC